MIGWMRLLHADPTEWLLEKENPSVRYFTLKNLLDKPDDDAEVKASKLAIMGSGRVPDILQKQRNSEYIARYSKFYTDKYSGLVWSLLVLSELGAEPTPEIREQCEYLLRFSQEQTEGGFSQNANIRAGGGRIREVIPCLTGNMVWSLIRMGYLDDPRIQKSIDWITEYMRFNDGIEISPQVEPYNHYEMCWGRHTCHMGVVKILKALSSIPEEKRSNAVRNTIDAAVEFLLAHHIYKRSHAPDRIAKPSWQKFGFPLMYQTDVLEIMTIFADLRVRDPRLNDAIHLILSKQEAGGRWRIENANDRMLVSFGERGEESKWLTLMALRVLKSYDDALESMGLHIT